MLRLRLYLPLFLLLTPGLPGVDLPPVGLWSPLEVHLPSDPAQRDLRPQAKFTRPDGTSVYAPGFAKPDGGWCAAVAADQPGAWSFAVTGPDGSLISEGKVQVERQRRSGGLLPAGPDSPWLRDEDRLVRPFRAVEVSSARFVGGRTRQQRWAEIGAVRNDGYSVVWLTEAPTVETALALEEYLALEGDTPLLWFVPRPTDSQLVVRWSAYRHVHWQDQPAASRFARIAADRSTAETAREVLHALFTGFMPLAAGGADHRGVRAAGAFTDRLPLADLRPSSHDGRPVLAGAAVRFVLFDKADPRPMTVPMDSANWLAAWARADALHAWTADQPQRAGAALTPPAEDVDWVLRLRPVHVSANPGRNPEIVAEGNYPDVAVADDGQVHLVYARDGALYHRRYDTVEDRWSAEEDTTLRYTGSNEDGPHRGDPEVVVDRQGRPHVLVGRSYAWKDNGRWLTTDSGLHRDHALAIDPAGNLWGVRRGGHHGGHVGVRLRRAGAEFWEPTATDADTGTVHGVAWRSRGDHPYGHLFSGPDEKVHVVYRQGEPQYIAYRWTSDLGRTWQGGGVHGGMLWQPESPSGHVSPDGTVWIIGPSGEVFRKIAEPSAFAFDARALVAGGRAYPVLSSDHGGHLYAGAFGGEFNVRQANGRWLSPRRLPSPTGQPLGYVAFAPIPGASRVYVAYEAGDNLHPEHVSGTGVILICTLDANGTVGLAH